MYFNHNIISILVKIMNRLINLINNKYIYISYDCINLMNSESKMMKHMYYININPYSLYIHSSIYNIIENMINLIGIYLIITNKMN